ncbi:MAG TPA: hypothetical protein DD429_02350 [Clostridiaceae bacterium]|nr:hypothetical protein [Clostridiaceae bacterium]
MNDESLKILSMLERGKINIDEAVRLLDALNTSASKPPMQTPFQDENLSQAVEAAVNNFNTDMPLISSKLCSRLIDSDSKLYDSISLDSQKLYEALKPVKGELEKLLDDMSKNMGKDAQTILSGLSDEMAGLKDTSSDENILHNGIDEIQKKYGNMNFNASELSSKLSGICAGMHENNITLNDYNLSWKKKIDKLSEIELHFECINGGICLEGYDGFDMELEINCKTHETSIDKIISLSDETKLLEIKARNEKNTIVNINVKIPYDIRCRIIVSSLNSKVRASNFSCVSMIYNISGGNINLSGITCNSIETNISDGKIEMSNLKANAIFIVSRHAPIILDCIYFNQCRINSSSASIYFILGEEIAGKSEINISSESGDVEIETSPLSKSVGIYIDAFLKKGNMILESIPEFLYYINETKKDGTSRIAGQNPSYDKADKAVKISIMAENASVLFS